MRGLKHKGAARSAGLDGTVLKRRRCSRTVAEANQHYTNGKWCVGALAHERRGRL